MNLLVKILLYFLILVVCSCNYKFEILENTSASLADKSGVSGAQNCPQLSSGLNLCFNSTGVMSLNNANDSTVSDLILNSGDYVYHIGVHEDFNSSEAFVRVQKVSYTGVIDTSYGIGGFSETPILGAGSNPTMTILTKAIMDDFGSIYVSGYFHENLDFQSFIIKINSAGELESDFDDSTACSVTGGCILINEDLVNNDYEYVLDMSIVGNNLVVLYTIVAATGAFYQIRKYNLTNANLDSSFGNKTDGISEFKDAGKSYKAMFLKIDTVNSYIYTVGEYIAAGEFEDLFVDKIDLSSGMLDLNTKLPQSTDVGIEFVNLKHIQFFENGNAYAFVEGNDLMGLIVHLYLYKFNYITGTNDNSWDGDGYMIVDDAAPGSNPYGTDFTKYVSINDEHYLCGSRYFVDKDQFSVVKIDSTGQVDTSWEDNGVFTNNFPYYTTCNDIIVDTNQNIMFTGIKNSFSYLFNIIL